MASGNTDTRFGSVSKAFHWIIVLLILALIPLGLAANATGLATPEQAALKMFLFSLHKTLGVTLFFLALARLFWAATQPRPAPLNRNTPLNAFMAQTVHWLLYGSLLLVPVLGWVSHAATQAPAPIWWPFGQGLPFVATNQSLGRTAGVLHVIFQRLLLVAIVLHILGALKHHLIDRDPTLRRMLPGTPDMPDMPPPSDRPPEHRPLAAAMAAGIGALLLGAASGLFAVQPPETAPAPPTRTTTNGWVVQDGTLSLTIRQFGKSVEGKFTDWTAAIEFDEFSTKPRRGRVDVSVTISSLQLGRATAPAMGFDFFNADDFPTASFTSDITLGIDGYLAAGTLTLRGIQIPVDLPFDLRIDGNRAEMNGRISLDRRDFSIGAPYTDETTLGYDVGVKINLIALRKP